jgi:hypothetical protein
LIIKELTQTGNHDRLRLEPRDRLPGAFLFLPTGWVGDAPAMWRWSPEDPSLIEVSCFKLDSDCDFVANIFTVPSWFRSDQDFHLWIDDPSAELSPEVLNALGFTYSFQWKLTDGPYWYLGLPNLNFEIARSYFERAAEKGFWAAVNNLGVIYRDGLGVAKDDAKAFSFFDRAAQSLEPISLGHLAECHSKGIGCPPNPELAAFILELIEVRKEEKSSAA